MHQNLPFAWVSWEMLYIALSVLVAVGIFWQSLLIKRNDKRIPSSAVFHLASFLDTLWVPISALALYFLTFDALAIVSPTLYLIYTFVGFFYTSKTFKRSNMPSDIKDIVFDDGHLSFLQAFGLVFASFNLFVLWATYQGLTLNWVFF